MSEFKSSLDKLQFSINDCIKKNIDVNKKIDPEKALYDFKEKKQDYYIKNFQSNLSLAKSNSLELSQLSRFDIKNQPLVDEILELIPELDQKDLNVLDKTVKKLILLTKQLNFPEKKVEKKFIIKTTLPIEIESDVKADLAEINKCFNAEAYRSAIILCGRILETILHRKYYEATNNDLLEKSPGIGLGNIIAKLKEKNIDIDPALTQQIHLINNVRVFSVHKKKQAFVPSKDQTHAIILYTLDILEKVFR